MHFYHPPTGSLRTDTKKEKENQSFDSENSSDSSDSECVLASLIADSAAGPVVDAAAADCVLLLQCLLHKSYPSRVIRFKYCKFQAFCVGDVGGDANLMFYGGGIGCVRNDAVDVVVAVENRSVLSHLQQFGNLTPTQSEPPP